MHFLCGLTYFFSLETRSLQEIKVYSLQITTDPASNFLNDNVRFRYYLDIFSEKCDMKNVIQMIYLKVTVLAILLAPRSSFYFSSSSPPSNNFSNLATLYTVLRSPYFLRLYTIPGELLSYPERITHPFSILSEHLSSILYLERIFLSICI